MTNKCEICGSSFEGRRDRKWCSLDCKKELKSLYDKQLHILNREKNIKRACSWQRANRQRKSEYDRIRRASFPEKAREARRRFVPDPEERRLTAGKRRARRRNQGVYTVTVKDLTRTLGRFGWHCAYCRGPFTDSNPLEWDHIIPIARGGTHSIGNLTPACKKCNRGKHIKLLVEWRAGRIVDTRTL